MKKFHINFHIRNSHNFRPWVRWSLFCEMMDDVEREKNKKTPESGQQIDCDCWKGHYLRYHSDDMEMPTNRWILALGEFTVVNWVLWIFWCHYLLVGRSSLASEPILECLKWGRQPSTIDGHQWWLMVDGAGHRDELPKKFSPPSTPQNSLRHLIISSLKEDIEHK